MQSHTKPIHEQKPSVKFAEKNLRNFWKKVNKDGPTQPHMESPCWEWVAGKGSHGYGVFQVGGKKLSSHRISWMLAHGPIPHDGSYHGICVCHHCDNKLCINPEHLFLGTQKENADDRTAKGRAAYGDRNGARLYPERVFRGEARWNARLTKVQVSAIRAIYAAKGVTQARLGERFNVDQSVISRIVNRRRWTHI